MRSRKFILRRKEIAEFCKRGSIIEFSVFGSVLGEDFRPDSDVDGYLSEIGDDPEILAIFDKMYNTVRNQSWDNKQLRF